MEEFMIPCLNKQIFGIDCPGCGAQRAFMLVFQGEFNAAFKMFPAVYSLIVLISFLIVNLFVKFKNDWLLKIGLIIFNAVIIIAAYIYKMNHFFN
ncbi:DUF2752 domain-containing protein [Salinimicrobium marinum]|uniref:DUF2752 domain-containing protein n=1 Tax=Salinimicrobium marinum TaxID=680283 RepID=UPI0016723433|nr:DUF2752 domain-containing protein [Salinimicrobium marinum]